MPEEKKEKNILCPYSVKDFPVDSFVKIKRYGEFKVAKIVDYDYFVYANTNTLVLIVKFEGQSAERRIPLVFESEVKVIDEKEKEIILAIGNEKKTKR